MSSLDRCLCHGGTAAERHHVARFVFAPSWTVPVCVRCHRALSAEQLQSGVPTTIDVQDSGFVNDGFRSGLIGLCNVLDLASANLDRGSFVNVSKFARTFCRSYGRRVPGRWRERRTSVFQRKTADFERDVAESVLLSLGSVVVSWLFALTGGEPNGSGSAFPLTVAVGRVADAIDGHVSVLRVLCSQPGGLLAMLHRDPEFGAVLVDVWSSALLAVLRGDDDAADRLRVLNDRILGTVVRCDG